MPLPLNRYPDTQMRPLSFSPRSACLISLIITLSCTGARAQTPSLEQALDTTNLVWTTGGDADWFGQTTNSHDGVSATQSGLIDPGQSSWLETTVVGPATLSFWTETIDPATFPSPATAYLTFAINPGSGPPMPGVHSSGWWQPLYDLPVGINVLRWTFHVYSSATNRAAAGFVDQVVLDAPRPLQFTYQPWDQTVFSRETVYAGVSVIGTPPFSYQWLKGGANISGATNSWLYLESATTNDTGVYSVLVTNVQGSVLSSNASLTVLPPSPPFITYQPYGATVYVGQAVSWRASADGSPPFEYQWRKDGTNLPRAASSYLSLTNVQLSDAGAYSYEVRNAEGSVVSSNAILTVLPTAAPIITAQPCSLNVAAGAAPTLSVQASGAPTPQYQWLRSGTNIAGAIGSSLSFTNATVADEGVYSVRVSNFAGTNFSRDALLTVLASPAPRGFWFQGVNDVCVTNNLAYLAQGSNGVGVLDISNPDSPILVGGFNTPGQANAVHIAGPFAYVADGAAGVQVLSLANPVNPISIGSYDTPRSAQDVVVAGNRAYVADWDGGLQILDVSNPAHPSWLGSFVTNMCAEAICVANDLAYVACPSVLSLITDPKTYGLQIINVSDPTQPDLLAATTSDAEGVVLLGDLALTAGANSGLRLFDVSNPAAPEMVGSYMPGTGPVGFPPRYQFLPVYDVQVAGNLAYLACGTSGIWVVDISLPSAPVNVARIPTTSFAKKLALIGNRAFIAMPDGGLQIVDMPANLGIQPSPALSISASNGLQLSLIGPAGAQFAIEHADNLTGSLWQPLQTVTLTNAPAILGLSPATATRHYFRARLVSP